MRPWDRDTICRTSEPKRASMSASTELSDFVKAKLSDNQWPELHDAMPASYRLHLAGKKF